MDSYLAGTLAGLGLGLAIGRYFGRREAILDQLSPRQRELAEERWTEWAYGWPNLIVVLFMIMGLPLVFLPLLFGLSGWTVYILGSVFIGFTFWVALVGVRKREKIAKDILGQQAGQSPQPR